MMRKIPLSSAKHKNRFKSTFSIGVNLSRLKSWRKRLEARLGRMSPAHLLWKDLCKLICMKEHHVQDKFAIARTDCTCEDSK